MDWIRHNLMALVVLVAIALSFAVSDRDSKARDRAQHAQIVATCERGSIRTALNAQFARDAAMVRRAAGDKAAADRYQSDYEGQVATIPAPSGLEGSAQMAEVVYAMIGGRSTAIVSQRAKALQAAGCERANP